MLRLFKESMTRRMYDLDGEWSYLADPAGDAKWGAGLPHGKKPIIIPGCWNNEPGMLHHEGDVWLETEFDTALPNIRLVFGGVNNECDVYLDGVHLGYHYGPFSEFAYTAEGLVPGTHKLVLRTNNVHNMTDTIPLSQVDWFHYGGIIRSVEVHEVRETLVERMKLAYTLDGNTADITATLALRAFGEVTVPVRLCLDGKVLAEETVTLCGEGKAILRAKLENVKLWQPDDPQLYTFTAEFGADSLRDRTGFRTIAIRGKEFLLNGTPIEFRGVNRHEEHPDWGFAVPAKLIKKDVDIIRGMGCNFIRGSHYPNAKITLDYMDETGMLFWEEIPMWGFLEEHLLNETVRKRGVQLHREMVTRDYNHPCIVVWGLNNEVETRKPAAREVAKLFRETLESYDTSRLITYATMMPLEDLCFDYADFISVNHYTGWYLGPKENWPAFLDKLEAYMDSTGNGHKPVVMSEFGAGGIYGVTELEEDVTWSENYQSDFLEYVLELFRADPRISGRLIWQYCDMRAGTRTCAEGISRALQRPRSFNNKGLVNEYRRPKMAYYTVKKAYSK